MKRDDCKPSRSYALVKKFFVNFLENAVKTARWQDYISRKVMRRESFHRLVDYVLCGGKSCVRGEKTIV